MDTQPGESPLTLVSSPPDDSAGSSGTEAPPSTASVRTPGRSKPTKILPTTRMSLAKQFETLRAWAIASGDGKGVNNQQVADIVGLRADTVTLGNAFFAD